MKKVDRCIICNNPLLVRYKGELEPFLRDRMFNDMDVKSDLFFCPNCHICFSETRPDDNEASRYYQNYMKKEYLDHRKKYQLNIMTEYEKFLNNEAEKGNIYKRQYIGELLERNLDLSKIQNVLDFGGSSGALIPDKLEHTNRCVYDIDEIPTIKGVNKITKEDIKKTTWDLILCSEVLEHVSYPMDIIKELLDIMPEGGYLCIDVPYERKGVHYMDDLTEPMYISEHINKFRPYTLNKIFNSMRYVVLEMPTVSFYDPKYVCSEGITICLVRKLRKDENAEQIKTMFQIKNSLLDTQKEIAKLNAKTENIVTIANFENYINRINNICQINVATANKKKLSFLEKIFSVRNDMDNKHKVVCILGIKMKFKRLIKSYLENKKSKSQKSLGGGANSSK